MSRYILSQFDLADLPKQLVITSSKAIASYLDVPHYSLESLATSIVRRRGMGIASTLLSRRLLQAAVREVIKTKDVEGTAKAFLPTVKDLLRSGIDLTKLQQNYDPRIQQLGSLVLAYQKQLRQRNRIDSGELYSQGAIAVAYQKAYLFYGYFAPGKDELTIINAIAGENSILVLPSNESFPQNQVATKWLQERGWELQPSSNPTVGINRLQDCFNQTSTLPAGVSLNVYPNLEAEVRGVLTQVKVLLIQGVSVKDIVLVTKEEQLYGKAVIDVAWEYNLPVEVDYEIPLEQTRVGAWFKLMLEVIRDNFPFEATAKLLSHPLANYMSAEIWLEARQTYPQGLSAWQKLGVDLSLFDFPQGSYSRDVWVRRLLEIFSNWDVLEKAKGWAREIVAYYRIQEALQEIRQPEAQQSSKRAFIKEIEEILALLSIPAQPGRGGIQLHCPTSLLGTNYAHVFVLGSAEGILPKAIADDPILDFYSRKQLAKQGSIETAVDLAQRETFYFYCLLGVPTQSIVFSYPEIIDRNPTVPSSYLSRLGLKPSPVNNLPVVSVESARRLYLRQANLVPHSSLLIPQIATAWQIEARRESSSPPDMYDGVIGIGIDPRSRTFSASGLTQLGQCPFKWFSARLLKLKELVEAESDLSAAFRGNLYHRCLELSLCQVKTADDLVKFNREQLVQIFTTAERELDLIQLPGWDAQRQEHLDLLELNLTTPEFLPPEREVVATETKFTTQWHGLQLRGQVDRIDRTHAGLMVIDYKTSSVTPAGIKDDEGKANIDLQLAVYQDAIAEQYPDEAIEGSTYYSISKRKNIGHRQQDPEKLAIFARQVESHLERGYYPVSPDIDRKACRYCDYDLVCRKGDRLKRKPN